MTTEDKKDKAQKFVHVKMGLLHRFSDDITLIERSPGGDNYDKELKKVLKVLKGKELGPNERQKIISKKQKGNWWAQCDTHNIVHIFLISVDYKNYLAGQMITESETKLGQVDEYYKMSPKEVYKAFDEEFGKILDKYNNPATCDALSSAQDKVDKATVKMQANLTTALENTQDLEVKFSNIFKRF